ncbi:MAG: hypothetical protein ACYTGP_12700, partial [Planctomycetota bacterium]
MSAHRPPGTKKRIKLTLLALAGVVAIGLILAAAAPMLISAGIGHGIIRGKIEDYMNGTVEFQRLRLSWLGVQEVEGLVVRDEQGATVADVNVRVNASLVAILRGVFGALEVDVDGAVHGTLREDGSLSFADLARPDPSGASKPERRPDEPPSLGGLGPTKLRLNGMAVTLEDARAQATYVLQDLTGTLAIVPGGTSNLRVVSGLRVDETLGSIEIEAVSEGLFDEGGVLDVDGTVVRSSIQLRNIPVPRYEDQLQRINVLDLDLVSEDLGRQIDLTAHLETLLPGGDVGTLDGRLTALEPVSRAGRPNVSLERVVGTVIGRDVPSALLTPLFAASPVDPVRDLGPTVDLDAAFGDGEAKQVTVNLTSDRIELVLDGVVNARDKTVVGNRLELNAAVQPELLAAVSPYSLRQPAPVAVNISYFSVPPLGPDGTLPLDRFHAAGSVLLGETANLYRHADDVPIADVSRFEVYFAPESLDPGAPIDRWGGSISLEGTLHEDTLQDHAGLPADRPAQLAVDVTDLALDSPLTGRPLRLDTMELRGSVTLDGPVRLIELDDAPLETTLQYAHMQFDGPRLGEGARIQGSAGLVGGALTFDEQLRDFIDVDGRLAIANLMAVGLVELRGVKPETLVRFLPEHAELIDAATNGPVSARLITAMDGDAPQARVFVFGGGTEVSARLTRREDGLHVDDGAATIRVTPKLVAVLQPDAAAPVVLGAEAYVSATMDPIVLPGKPPFSYELGADPIRTHATVDRLVLDEVP